MRAAITYTTRQLDSCAMTPEIERARRMPSKSPLMTMPTTRPRSWSFESDAAMGTSSWAATLPSPTIKVIATRTPTSGAKAEMNSPITVISKTEGTSRRRGSMSPRGRMKARPIA